MPIYMDVHIVPGVNAKDVAEAHRKDLLIQEEYGCKCMTYWIDEKRESIFCLLEAPDKDTVEELHSKAHGLIPNKIIEVSRNTADLEAAFWRRGALVLPGSRPDHGAKDKKDADAAACLRLAGIPITMHMSVFPSLSAGEAPAFPDPL